MSPPSSGLVAAQAAVRGTLVSPTPTPTPNLPPAHRSGAFWLVFLVLVALLLLSSWRLRRAR